nr:hypothetical protein [Pandoravirus belohorizontensis]
MALCFVSRKERERERERERKDAPACSIGQRRAVRKGYLARRALLRFDRRHVGGRENVLIVLHPCFFFLCRECASALCVLCLLRWSLQAQQIKKRLEKERRNWPRCPIAVCCIFEEVKKQSAPSTLLVRTGGIGRTADAMATKSLLSLCRSRLILLSGCARHKKGNCRKPDRHQNQDARSTGVF